MFYEISNVVFNHKPTEWEIRHRNPFYPTKKNKVGKTEVPGPVGGGGKVAQANRFCQI